MHVADGVRMHFLRASALLVCLALPTSAFAQATPAPRIKSKALVAVGSVLSFLGTGGLVASGIWLNSALHPDCPPVSQYGIGLEGLCPSFSVISAASSGALVGVSALHVLAGVPMIAVGALPHPEDAPSAPPPAVSISATATGLKLSF